MSEMERHVAATGVEDARHAEAGETEMALHSSNTPSPEETVAHLSALTLERDITTARTRHEMYRAVVVLGLLVFGIIALALFSVVGRGNDVEEARKDVVAARLASEASGRKLDAALTELEQRRVAELDLTICADRFINAQRGTNLEAFAAQAEIVATLIPAEPPLSDDVRRAELRRLRQVQQDRIDEYRDVIAQSKAWGEAGRPLPCPLVEP